MCKDVNSYIFFPQDYLEAKTLAVQDVLDVCLEKMQQGTYTCPGEISQVFTHLSDFVSCYHNAQKRKTERISKYWYCLDMKA